MANTYQLIASNTLTANTASVSFSAIPNTFTDLLLRLSLRSTLSGTTGFYYIQPNGDTATTNYSTTRIEAGSGSASSSRVTTATGFPGALIYDLTGSTATANTFTSSEVYIPNYLVSQRRQMGSFSVDENNNASLTYMTVNAHLYQVTTPLTSVKVSAQAGTSFVSGSSFFLYGIKNS